MSSNGEDLDGELGRLFEAQCRADESSAPDVRELLARLKDHRARSRRIRSGRSILLAAAAMIVVAMSVILLRSNPRQAHQTPLPAVATQIAEWKAPTDVLLQTPGSDLLRQLPVLEFRASEAASAVFEPTKGVEK